MKKVYVVNKGAHDYSGASKFGTLIYCTTGLVSKYNTAQMVREIESALVDSTVDDYLLLTAFSTLCSVATAYFTYKHGLLNILIFKDDGYVERRVRFNN